MALLRPEERKRANEQNDEFFYSVPRFVQYVDEHFTRQVKSAITPSSPRRCTFFLDWYQQHLKEGDAVLDLCASYDSHLPEMQFSRVAGHGMCGPELAANSALSSYFVQNFNENPSVSIGDAAFDAVLCCMGLQYLKFPEDVCQQVYHALKPGGRFLVSFTSHCFPEKTITGWLERSLDERAELIKQLLVAAGFVEVQAVSCVATPNCPQIISDSVTDCSIDAEMCPSMDYPWNDLEASSDLDCDPFYGVVGTKPVTSTFSKAMEFAPFQLDVLNELDLAQSAQLPYYRYQRVIGAYRSLCDWAVSLGIPQSAVWFPTEHETMESLKEKRDYMRGMIASFVSSGL